MSDHIGCWDASHGNGCSKTSVYKHTHTYPFYGPFSRTTRVSRYQKGKTNLNFTEARSSEWQVNKLGHMQVCTSLQTDNHASTQPFSFLQTGCPSCRPTNSVKALKGYQYTKYIYIYNVQQEAEDDLSSLRDARYWPRGSMVTPWTKPLCSVNIHNLWPAPPSHQTPQWVLLDTNYYSSDIHS